MASADPVFESLQRLQSMMESFDESLSKLCKDNMSESALDLRKNLMEYYRDLLKALQSRYETLKIKEKKPEEPRARGKNKKNKTTKVTVLSSSGSSFNKVLSSVGAGSEIKTLCDKADGRGLINYIIENRKEFETLRSELPMALSKAPDAAKLVLNALQGYDFSKSGSNVRDRTLTLCSTNRRACVFLMESLFPIFGNDESGVVPSDIKESAREIAKVWRKEMKIEKNPESASQLDVQAFLQLLVTFRIAVDYEKDDLWELVLAITRRKQTPELCRSLGLSSKVPDLMDKLSKSGRPITVLTFARKFGMMDKIDPVDLLTSYLRDAEKAAKELLTNGHGSVDSQYYSNMKKLSAVNTAINIVKEYALQCHFFEDKLQKKYRTLMQRKIDLNKKRKKDTKKNTQEKEDRRKAAEKRIERKRLQAFEPGYGRHRREALKRAKLASLNETTMAGGMGNSKVSPDNIDDAQKKSGIIGHDHHTSAFSDANRSSTGLAAGAFTSVPSIAAQINDERRRHPSAFGTSNLRPIGSSLNGSSVLASAFAVPLPNIADVNYEGRGQQSYTMNFGEIDKSHVRASIYGTGDFAKSSANQSNHNYEGRGQQSYKLNFDEVYDNPVRASIYGTGDLAKSSANQSNDNYEGRGQQSYKLNFGEVYDNPVRASIYGTGDLAKSSDNQSNHNYEGRYQQSYKLNFGEVYDNPVSASAYETGILANPSGTGSHYERRGPGLYTSAFDNTGSIGSSVYGSSSHMFPSSDVNQGGHERSLGQYSGFAGRNMVPIESSGYGHGASTVPPSNVTQGHFGSRGSVKDNYQFKSGLASLPPTY